MRKHCQTLQNSEFTWSNASVSHWQCMGTGKVVFKISKIRLRIILNYSGSLNFRKAVITESFKITSEIIRSFQGVVERLVEC